MSNMHFNPSCGGLVGFSSERLSSFSFRWHETQRPRGLYAVGTSKPATDEGRPAVLQRNFDAVCDDFGTLVEVAQ